MDYVAGPLIALLLGMKFADWETKGVEKRVEEIAKSCEERVIETNTNTSKTIIATMKPVARAIKVLNEQVGIQ